MKVKEVYTTPQTEIICFETEDVINTSGAGSGGVGEDVDED